MDGRTLLARGVSACLSTTVLAAPYDFNGTPVEIDDWFGSGTSESVIVIDWNQTNGPYVTEAHAWGYRWDSPTSVKNALLAIEAGSALTMEYAFGGGFINNAWYNDGIDNHTTDGYAGWVWTGSTADGGGTVVLNGDGVDVELLEHNVIEAINWNPGDWTGANFTIPVPEPATGLLLMLPMAVVLLRRRRR
jgi:hypothetical protein